MPREQKNTAIYVAYDDFEPLDIAMPEKSLLKAILLTAMSDLKKQGIVGRRAMEYFLNPQEDYLFSFKSICSYLDIDSEKILGVIGLRNSRQSSYQNGKEPVQ